MVNPDFGPRLALDSDDLVYWYSFSQSNPGGGADTAMTVPIRKDAAAVMMVSSGAAWVNLEGQAQGASGSPASFGVNTNWTPLIGLELDGDLTIHFTATAVGVFLSVIVLKRRRRLAPTPSYV